MTDAVLVAQGQNVVGKAHEGPAKMAVIETTVVVKWFKNEKVSTDIAAPGVLYCVGFGHGPRSSYPPVIAN